MRIIVDKEKKRVYINVKEYIMISTYNDNEFGNIIKCGTLKYKNRKRFYLLEKNNNYEIIDNEEILRKIVEKYELPLSDGIIN